MISYHKISLPANNRQPREIPRHMYRRLRCAEMPLYKSAIFWRQMRILYAFYTYYFCGKNDKSRGKAETEEMGKKIKGEKWEK